MRKALLAILLLASPALAVDIHDTRLLTPPAISGDRIAFSYANDLWVANLDGTNVRRLTSHPGVEGNPRFSPDGKWIAFSGEYDGNVDVYIVSSEGGEPRRLTWLGAQSFARGWTPDGRVLFTTDARQPFRQLYAMYAVDIDGEGPVRGDRFGDHRVVIAAEVAHALAETGVRAQERRVFLLGPAIGEITLHEHRVGIERLDGVDRGPVHDLGIGLGAGLGGEDRPELLRCAAHTTLHLAEVDVVDGRDGGEQSAARLIQGRDLGREHR